MTLQRPADARQALEQVERVVKRLDRYERRQQKDMYDWAARMLAELRAG